MIYLFDPFRDLRSHDSQYVVIDSVFIQLFYIFHHSLISRFSRPVMPVSVVDSAVAVHRYSHKEIIFLKQAAPLIVQGEAVRLHRIHNPHLIPVKSLLQFQSFLIETDSTQSGFAALKCKADFTSRLMHGFPDQVFQSSFRHHSIGRYAAFLHLVTVKTIITMHVAQSGNRFDQYRI